MFSQVIAPAYAQVLGKAAQLLGLQTSTAGPEEGIVICLATTFTSCNCAYR